MSITLTCTGCGNSYQLKEEHAGRKVRCPGCNSVQIVPIPSSDGYPMNSPGADGAASGTGLHPAFNHDKFLLRQKMMTIGSKYLVWDEQQQPILFIERPVHFWRSLLGAFGAAGVFLVTFIPGLVLGLGVMERLEVKAVGGALILVLLLTSVVLTIATAIALSPKRHINFYADESKTEMLLKVLQDKKVAFITATYTLLSPEGELLGRMRKNYLYNIFRKKWDVFGPQGEKVLIAREDSLILSLLRRFLGPFFGLLRTNFILVTPEANGQEQLRGEFNRKFTLFDRYVLDMSRDRARMIDRRIAVAMGVLLDTGEHR